MHVPTSKPPHLTNRKRDTVRVYADVVCDLFHAGHVEFLRQCRALGDELVVGVHSDEDVANYKRMPILTLNERVAVVAACRYVDFVIPFAPLACTCAYLDGLEAQFAVHGDDLSPELLNRFYGELVASRRLRVVPYTHGISTSDLISRIISRHTSLPLTP